MIQTTDLYRALQTFQPLPDEEQDAILSQPPARPLFIVAGPGTGKTTVLTLRILKLIFVDGIPPRGILATTFTQKAAEELRSRVLGRGFRLLDALAQDPHLTPAQKAELAGIDINQVWTGTVDSLCDQFLRTAREPGMQPPLLADDFVAKTLLLRQGVLNQQRYQDEDLDRFLLRLYSPNGNRYGYDAGQKTQLLQALGERRFQDRIDWDSFLATGPVEEHPARQRVQEALADYAQALAERHMVDFARLEASVCDGLLEGRFAALTQDLRVLLVDEYQDTNLMQESLYFGLAEACGGALTVVGDDDQSLYRFRGATVELFREFPSRYAARFGNLPEPFFLRKNYRSTRRIVSFVNAYATLDGAYQQVRVPDKPSLQEGPAATDGMPVLAMFRGSLDELARDLADLIRAVFRGDGYPLPDGSRLERSPAGGDMGDCALLCSSPKERNGSDQPRLPHLLRDELEGGDPPILVFNPRGQDMAGVALVARFGGLLLECLDPGAAVQAIMADQRRLEPRMVQVFDRWRAVAIAFAEEAAAPAGLLPYALGWANRDPGRPGFQWPRRVSVLELIYGLVHYLPELHDDSEGQVYLEIFTRQLAACEQVSPFQARLVGDPGHPGLEQAAVRGLLRDFLAPIASGTVQVNEDLLESFPRDRLSLLSIHQAKGLEFPLTIVDVGLDFRSKHHTQEFRRFPSDGGVPHRMEDLLRPYSPLGVPIRNQRDRAFDDLYRQFFVAFSRPRDVLLLVGLTPGAPGGRVPNIATGWTRDGACLWAPPTMPLLLI